MRCKFLIILFAILLIQLNVYANIYDMSVPLEGQSIASDKLQQKVVKDIYLYISSKHPSCTDFKISDTQLLHLPYDTVKKNGRYIKGYWDELWTISYCGERTQIPVKFVIKKKNVIYKYEKNLY